MNQSISLSQFALEVKNVSKEYKDKIALSQVSFSVPKGSIFGLLGPNGAGKTTLLRIITGIFEAGSGEVLIDGQPTQLLSNSSKIGYMPEERGLYKKMKVEEQAIYLAQLKGLPYSIAKEKVAYWIEKLGMTTWKDKKLEELSKGMGQKLQFVCTVVHEPSLLILDEPFTGLDPLNADLIKNEIYELAQKGTTIIFSTHRMEQVEEICEKIVLINNGKVILNSDVRSAKKQFLKNEFWIELENGDISLPHSFKFIEKNNNIWKVALKPNFTISDLLQELAESKLPIRKISENLPSLNQIFIELVTAKNQ